MYQDVYYDVICGGKKLVPIWGPLLEMVQMKCVSCNSMEYYAELEATNQTAMWTDLKNIVLNLKKETE